MGVSSLLSDVKNLQGIKESTGSFIQEYLTGSTWGCSLFLFTLVTVNPRNGTGDRDTLRLREMVDDNIACKFQCRRDVAEWS